jgi:hypothetical protein
MKCPHCGHDESRVTETRPGELADRRIRLCRGCGKTFQTLERVAVYAGRSTGYVELLTPTPPALEPVPAPAPPVAAVAEPAPRAQRLPRFTAIDVPDEFGVIAEAVPLLLQWWNESRRSKHGARATWTEAAWLSSVKRVGELRPARQLELCRAGVENGWQALKVEYLQGAFDSAPPAPAGPRPMPRDPAMLAALQEEQWPA